MCSDVLLAKQQANSDKVRGESKNFKQQERVVPLVVKLAYNTIQFFQNVKLGFAMTFKEQNFAKISCREIHRGVIPKY